MISYALLWMVMVVSVPGPQAVSRAAIDQAILASAVHRVEAAERKLPLYPIRANWWTGCASWRHMTQGVHATQFSIVWLQQLSWAELQSLHSDAHEGRVKWHLIPPPEITADMKRTGCTFVFENGRWVKVCPLGRIVK